MRARRYRNGFLRAVILLVNRRANQATRADNDINRVDPSSPDSRTRPDVSRSMIYTYTMRMETVGKRRISTLAFAGPKEGGLDENGELYIHVIL